MIMLDRNLKSWAVARSIYQCGIALSFDSKKSSLLRPQFIKNGLISFGQERDLVFSEKNILSLHKNNFAFPEIRFFVIRPLSGFRKIRILQKIGSYIRSNNTNFDHLLALIAASLEATVVYMNNHSDCLKIMANDNGTVAFYLYESEIPLISIYKENYKGWIVQTEELKFEPSVKLKFKSIEVAINSCLGKINPLVASAIGEYRVEGYLPLMDKVGYCARVVGKELPL